MVEVWKSLIVLAEVATKVEKVVTQWLVIGGEGRSAFWIGLRFGIVVEFVVD